MKAVSIEEGSGASGEAVMAVYPRHEAVVDAFKARGDIVGIGPFIGGDNMALFRTGAAAEAFSKEDPFIADQSASDFFGKLEAPPGFEPGVEVLRT